MSRSVTFYPGTLNGEIRIPSSKSVSHRLLIAAALAPGESIVRRVDPSNDIHATVQVLSALGAAIRTESGSGGSVDYYISGITPGHSDTVKSADCGESGSTLRFLVPVAAALGLPVRFTGHGRLPERPMGELIDALTAHGAAISTPAGYTLPLTLHGQLTPGEYTLPGNISSQYFTGLLFALPLLNGDSRLTIAGKLESAAYIDLTIDALKTAGIHIKKEANGFIIPGDQHYQPFETQAEGDWSQAVFFLAAGALGGDIRLTGLNPESAQGDRACCQILRAFGADLFWEGNTLRCRGGDLHGCEIDAAQIPDLVPALAACSCLCRGETHIYGAHRLRLKESDRIASTCAMIRSLGGVAEPDDDGITTRLSHLHGGTVRSFNDHRILMSAAVLALKADGPVTVDQAECVNKSYPRFFEDYRKLGGIADVIDTRDEL